uniref:Uncharacterized protein n=1 Tax=Ciona savignyi TaxID=51511 RepID=H2YBY9_CIOSA
MSDSASTVGSVSTVEEKQDIEELSEDLVYKSGIDMEKLETLYPGWRLDPREVAQRRLDSLQKQRNNRTIEDFVSEMSQRAKQTKVSANPSEVVDSVATKVDVSAISPKVDESSFSPKADESAFSPKVDESSFSPKVDESSFSPKVDESSFSPKVDESSFSPKVDESL